MVIAALALARFLFELDGTAVGTVVLALDGDRYTYTSTHAYRRTQAERSDAFTVAPGTPVPEGLWLWHPPKPGCVEGVAELSRETGKLCADTVSDREVKGTTLGRAFTAQYRGGELQSLVVGKARFVRSSEALAAGQPYAQGFSIEGSGKRLALEPEVEGARWLDKPPRGAASKPLAEADSCLEAARAYVAAHPRVHVTLGLVVENGRAYPHAWASDVDPSAKAGTQSGAYLELPREKAGALYLELLEGKRKLVWR